MSTFTKKVCVTTISHMFAVISLYLIDDIPLWLPVLCNTSCNLRFKILFYFNFISVICGGIFTKAILSCWCLVPPRFFASTKEGFISKTFSAFCTDRHMLFIQSSPSTCRPVTHVWGSWCGIHSKTLSFVRYKKLFKESVCAWTGHCSLPRLQLRIMFAVDE